MAEFKFSRVLTVAEEEELPVEQYDAYVEWLETRKNKNCNDRKSLLPLYVYKILQKHTNKYRHFTYNQIIEHLERYPYEITVERKAVGRTVNLLANESLGVHSDRSSGSWYEPEEDGNEIRYAA